MPKQIDKMKLLDELKSDLKVSKRRGEEDLSDYLAILIAVIERGDYDKAD